MQQRCAIARVAVLGLSATMLAGCGDSGAEASSERMRFDHEVLAEGQSVWGKALGDLNDDGLLDVVIAERGKQRVVSFLAPQWQERVLAEGIAPTTGIVVGDVTGSGAADVVVATDSGVIVLIAPEWQRIPVGEGNMHDVRLADLDLDGRMDIAARNQTAFRDQVAEVRIFLQRESGWSTQVIETRPGEGLAVGDVDADGAPDLVINSAWYRNLGSKGTSEVGFEHYEYAKQWDWPHASVALGYIDLDNRLDIVLAPAELAGDHYRMSWFAQPEHVTSPWTEHVIARELESVQHGLQLADFDGDGGVDVLRSQMAQGADPDPVSIHINPRGTGVWREFTLSEMGSHSVQAADVDRDGDADILGANWSGEADVTLWRNRACHGAFSARVSRHVIGENAVGKNLFVLSADLDGDGRLDLAAGSSWYRNSGQGRWSAAEFGAGVGNVVLIHDFDRDGRTDALYTPWAGSGGDARLGIAWNRGRGGFEAGPLFAGEAGDFLQGVVLLDSGDGKSRVALSWHNGARGIELLEVPETRSEPARRSWISEVSQEEDLSVGDIDNDGDPDLLLGTIWLENRGAEWIEHAISAGAAKPDRNELADMNGDGFLDAVVGFEAISSPGKVSWYENPGKVQSQWREHTLAGVTGPMSLGVTDADRDGDLDVFVGEHNLKAPDSAKLWLLENTGPARQWSSHVVTVGDEHHDGLVVQDLDSDGDFDIASVGWSHGRVHVYESLASSCIAARRAVQQGARP